MEALWFDPLHSYLIVELDDRRISTTQLTHIDDLGAANAGLAPVLMDVAAKQEIWLKLLNEAAQAD